MYKLYKHRVKIKIDYDSPSGCFCGTTIATINQWLYENCLHPYGMEVIQTSLEHYPFEPPILTMTFEEETDAVAFKLTWT